MQIKNILPNVEKLSKKDSDLSTKRYADLRLINHVILQSWCILAILTYNKMWPELSLHFAFLAALCFGRGLLAKESFLNKITKSDANIS